MKRVFRTMLHQLLFVIVLFGLTPAYASPIVSIQPSSSIVTFGDSFSLEVSVSDVVDLYGFQFDVIFSPDVLSLLMIALMEPPCDRLNGATPAIVIAPIEPLRDRPNGATLRSP